MKQGFLVVITGFPAAGKDSIADILSEKSELNLQKIVTYNTRPPRPGERPGVDHHFVTIEEFTKLKEENKLAEYVETGMSFKGTPREPFFQVIEKQSRFIWRNNPYRAANLSEFYTGVFGEEKGSLLTKQSVTFFLTASSKDVLRKRWLKRSNTDLESFEKRYNEDLEVFNKYRERFNHIIENDNRPIHSTAREIIKILKQY